MKMISAIPALPVKDMKKSVKFYKQMLGFTKVHLDDGFAVLKNDMVELHLWEANDESWRERKVKEPVQSGAESFLAGTASCRIRVEGVAGLFEDMRRKNILHPNTDLKTQWWGERDFAVTDLDNNLITFYENIKE
ncbi:VOC family protein [Thalassobacillus pellis]|uniref:VOC family protein n=1 Tax=Thalassobacillus pellis TaxID=748008 RepID=UPI00196048FC|nr:catechol 2,3-dioxygenase-like lactoylglutathione lyase family enzyme [Thalassobacillus pellis]